MFTMLLPFALLIIVAAVFAATDSGFVRLASVAGWAFVTYQLVSPMI